MHSFFTIILFLLIIRQLYNLILIFKAPKISPEEVKKLKKNEYILLDVRTTREYKNYHIKGSKHLPLNQLSQGKKELPNDKKIVVLCQSGTRSARATMQLLKSGFNDVKSLKGGITKW